ncbi:MAG: glycoside hydrolase family 18 protein [Terracidiphilus sp.]
MKALVGQLLDTNKHILGRSFLFMVACLCGCSAVFAETPVPKPVIVAYVFPQDNPIHPGEIAAQKLTRINYAFANIKSGRIVNGFANDDQNMAALVALKQENPSLTVLVSVGGWLWSGAFSDMALSKKSRGVFIASVVEFVRQHQLDGLDVDWEYPGLPGAEPHFRVEDKQNYTLLLKELRTRFNGLEKELHRPLYVTAATGASSEFLAHTEMEKVQRYVDTVNLMAYDYYEPDSDSITGNHAPLYADPADPKRISADISVQEYEKAGVPADKIVLGVPFYGHVWGEVPDKNHGLFQPGKEIPHGYAAYGDGPDGMMKNGFTRYWDSAASVPYLYNSEKKIFESYEDAESLGVKCKYVLDHQLRGIMFWDYESDSSGALLNAVNDGFYKDRGAQGVSK